MAICFIIPPHILEAIARNGTDEQKHAALDSIALSQAIREKRQAFVPSTSFASNTSTGSTCNVAAEGQGTTSQGKNRIIYTDNQTTTLPGTKELSEGDAAGADIAANQAYLGTGATFDLYWNAYQRNSIDNKGLDLISTVHYSTRYDNAFWDGEQMVYGDGDGQLFTLFTTPIDVTGHELTHGVTQYSANLDYQDESGALNESFSDCFGSIVKQQHLGQTARAADWLIGEGIFTSGVKGVALRSMKAPGTAFDDPVLGKDPQPADMSQFVKTIDDNGGVHTNSGIPNHAFYLAATGIGGNVADGAGKIWYGVLTSVLQHDANFVDCANATITMAGKLFGDKSREQTCVQEAWKKVGVL